LLANVDKLPLDAALNCVLTAFQTLQGPGKELQIDQKEYVVPLYAQLPRLCSESNSQYTSLALKCLDAAFIRRRDYSLARVAAFVKQLLTVAMHTPAHCSVALISLVRSLNGRYSGVHKLLENEQEIITSGAYNPDADDPELANPFATCAWELGTLKFHIQREVARQADDCASLKLMLLPKEAPENLYGELRQDSRDGYISQKVVIRKHPLRPPAREKRKRAQYRFITPRNTKDLHLINMEHYL